jgi:hypothetical protein
MGRIVIVTAAGLMLAVLAVFNGCGDDAGACEGLDKGDPCRTGGGKAGFCETAGGTCLQSCGGVKAECKDLQGQGCYPLMRDKFVCLGAGDPKKDGDECDAGKPNDCGTGLYCVQFSDKARCVTPCTEVKDCGSRAGVTCGDAYGWGWAVCQPLWGK